MSASVTAKRPGWSRTNRGVVLRPTVVGLESGKVYNLADDVSCASILIL